MNKKEILTQALQARIEEVEQYQINIDNFKRAIAKASADPSLTEFVAQLSDLLQSSEYEQKKAKVMLEVVQEQLEELI